MRTHGHKSNRSKRGGPCGTRSKAPRDRGRDGPPNLGPPNPWSWVPPARGSQVPRSPDRSGRGSRRSAVRSIGVMNLKGGSGKTTTALSLAVRAAMRDLRVLLIDGDPQANATMTMLDGQPVEDPTIGHVLLDQAEAHEAIRATRVQGSTSSPPMPSSPTPRSC